jgi:hypothetical protein
MMLKQGVHEGLRCFSSEFDMTQLTYSVSFRVGKSVLIKEETLGKSNISFINDVAMIYINSIIIVTDKEENNKHYMCYNLYTTT